MEKFFLTDSAKLQCNCGSIISELKVTSQTFSYIGDFLGATEKDNQTGLNISSFGSCSQTKKACSPQPLAWVNTVNWNRIGENASITDYSTLPCAVGGLISCKENTQYFSGIETEEPSKYSDSILSEGKEGNNKEQPQAYRLLKDGTLQKDAELETETVDRIYAVGENGNLLQEIYIDLEEAEQIESTWENLASNSYKFSYFKIKDKQKSLEVFEFLSDNNQENEWARITIVHKKQINNYIGTSNSGEKGNVRVDLFLDTINLNIRYIIEVDHSHPYNVIEKNGRASMLPSGFNTKTGESYERGDSNFALYYINRLKYSTLILKVYDTYNKRYIEYNATRIYNFDNL